MGFHIHGSGKLERDMRRLGQLRGVRIRVPLASWWREQFGIRELDRLGISLIGCVLIKVINSIN